MPKLTNLIAMVLFTASSVAAGAAQGTPDRFEVAAIKNVRPNLVNTLGALQRRDVAAAKEAFEAFDAAWNGIEVYINVRSSDMYKLLELDLEARIMKGLKASPPDVAVLTSDVQTMIAKYDDAIAMVSKGAPLHPLFDDVARLRIVRVLLRDVVPALNAGNVARARKLFMSFDEKWDGIEDLVKARSRDAYDGIEKGMIQIERALMPTAPDVNEVTTLVKGVMDQYNGVVAQVARDARATVQKAQ